MNTTISHLTFRTAPIRMSDVRLKVIARLGGESFDLATMANECWPGFDNPNNDAGHDFWRMLDKTAQEFGYGFNPGRQMYVRLWS